MTRRKIATLTLGILCWIGLQCVANTVDKPLKIRAIYPTGAEVPTSDRITIEFNQNVVALGASMFVDDVVPIDIEPAVNCEWNWVKLDTLQCELPVDNNLAGSTQYTVTVRPEIYSLHGTALDKEYVHVFATKVPAITRSYLRSWISPTQPVIEVSFNQDVKLNTLPDRLMFYDSDSKREITARVWPYHREISRQLSDDYFGSDNLDQVYAYLERRTLGRVSDRQVIVMPAESLPPDSAVSLVLLPGIEGESGNLTTAERVTTSTDIRTFSDFRLVGLRCRDVLNHEVFLTPDHSSEKKCDATSSVSMVFSSPFLKWDIGDFISIEPMIENVDDKHNRIDTWGNRRRSERGFVYRIRESFQYNTTYRISLGEAGQTEENQTQSQPVTDGFGRPLVGPNTIEFRTARPEPRTRLNRVDMVVDSHSAVEPQVVTLNVDDVSVTYSTLDERGVQQNQVQRLQSSVKDDAEEVQALNLRQKLRSPSGVISGLVTSRPRFEHTTESIERYFFAQATPYSVFLKLGTIASLAWVVDLQTGEPAANTDVVLYLGTPFDFGDIRTTIHEGKTDVNGFLRLPGYEHFDPYWDRSRYSINEDCSDESDCSMYLLSVNGNSGMALLPVDSSYGIRGSHSFDSVHGNLQHWATTSQGLYLPGETVHIKGYIRDWTDDIRIIPEMGHFGLCIDGPQGQEYEITPIMLNEFGSYFAKVKLNDKAILGEYKLWITYDLENAITSPCGATYGVPGRYSVEGGSFEVFEFKTNSIAVDHTLNAESYEPNDRMTIHSTAELHAGGPYAYAAGEVVVDHNTYVEFPFESVSPEQYVVNLRGNADSRQTIVDVNIELDVDGKHSHTVKIPDTGAYFAGLEVESVVKSDRGKSVVDRSTVDYFGVDEFVAIRRPDIFYSYSRFDERIQVGEPWPVEVLVLSKQDTIETGKRVHITVFEDQTDRTTKRPSNSVTVYGEYDWKEVFSCELVTGAESVGCDFTPPESTAYRVVASIKDTKGRTHTSSLQVRATTETISRRRVADEKNLELECNLTEVVVGDLIRCEVENFLSSAPALVTVERTGVLDEWLVRLSPNNPYIEFRVDEEFAPHFQLSVLSWTPLGIDPVSQGALYRTATSSFEFKNSELPPLNVSIAVDQDTYQPRDTVKLTVSNTEKTLSNTPIEYAIAVVDEALLDLKITGDEYFDPTQREWTIEPNPVRTYGLIAALLRESDLLSNTDLEDYSVRTTEDLNSTESLVDYFRGTPQQAEGMTVTGSYMLAKTPSFQEAERDTDPNIRSVDRFVAYWNPSVVTTEHNRTLQFELPDNLTRWKVLVLAVSTEDRFGFTSTTFSTVKDTEIRPVAPNVVTEGDTFQVGASILNRSGRERQLMVELQISGLVAAHSQKSHSSQELFQPFERKVVTWDLEAGELPTPSDLRHPIPSAEISLIARAGDDIDGDALNIRIPVRSNLVRVSSVAYGALAGDKSTIPIEVPASLSNDVGQLDFTLTTGNSINLDGVFRDTMYYPYACWEQELTRAVLAMQYLNLEQQGAKHGFEWTDPKGTIERVLDSASVFQRYGGKMGFYPLNRRNDGGNTYLSAYTLIAFSWLEHAGYDIPAKVKHKLIAALQKHIESQTERLSKSDASELLQRLDATRVAMSLNALSSYEELSNTDLIFFSSQIDRMDLFGLTNYLLAILQFDTEHELRDIVFEKIMNHRSLVDGAVEFVESVPRSFFEIMHSDTRSMCSVLTALTTLSSTTSVGLDLGELNALSDTVRYARDNLPSWQNTQANVYCTNAMIGYLEYIDDEVGDLVATVNLRGKDTTYDARLARGWEFNSDRTQLQTTHPFDVHAIGAQSALEIHSRGKGTAFYNVELSYLTEINERINRYSGFEVHRQYVVYRDRKWQILRPGDSINRGEHVLVILYLNNRFSRHHVVLEDSVPGGLEPVNLNLSSEYVPPIDWRELEDTLSTNRLFRQYESYFGLGGFYYRELGLEKVRYFAENVRRGKMRLAWLGQAISAGNFTVLPTHVEEMYRPIMFGKSEPLKLIVKP